METPTPLPCTFPGTIVPWNNAPALYTPGKKRGQAGKPSRLLSHQPALASQAEAWETQRLNSHYPHERPRPKKQISRAGHMTDPRQLWVPHSCRKRPTLSPFMPSVYRHANAQVPKVPHHPSPTLSEVRLPLIYSSQTVWLQL